MARAKLKIQIGRFGLESSTHKYNVSQVVSRMPSVCLAIMPTKRTKLVRRKCLDVPLENNVSNNNIFVVLLSTLDLDSVLSFLNN